MSSAHFSFHLPPIPPLHFSSHLPPIPPSHFRLVPTLFSPHFHFNSTFFLHYFSPQLPSRFLSRYNFARVQTRRKLFRHSLSRKRTKKLIKYNKPRTTLPPRRINATRPKREPHIEAHQIKTQNKPTKNAATLFTKKLINY